MHLEDGSWSGLSLDSHTVEKMVPSYVPKRLVDAFNSFVFGPEQRPACKLNVFSFYGEEARSGLVPEFIVEEPVMVGGLEQMEAMWSLYLDKAIEINKENRDYHLTQFNCHTANSVLNSVNLDAVKAFKDRGFMRFGVNPEAINIPEQSALVVRSLEDVQRQNENLSNHVYAHCVGYARWVEENAQADCEQSASDYEASLA